MNCKHKWRHSTDWLGDPSIPNGTQSWSVWTCSKCGDETTEQPDDWEDDFDPDYERDRRIDDALTGDL
jgi:hypothetical protein